VQPRIGLLVIIGSRRRATEALYSRYRPTCLEKVAVLAGGALVVQALILVLPPGHSAASSVGLDPLLNVLVGLKGEPWAPGRFCNCFVSLQGFLLEQEDSSEQGPLSGRLPAIAQALPHGQPSGQRNSKQRGASTASALQSPHGRS